MRVELFYRLSTSKIESSVQMTQFYRKEFFDGIFSKKNWEKEISHVCVEACDHVEDPLGYRAAFFITDGAQTSLEVVTAMSPAFTVGASFLVKRQENLSRSGYEAPMTEKAINLIERKLGQVLTGITSSSA